MIIVTGQCWKNMLLKNMLLKEYVLNFTLAALEMFAGLYFLIKPYDTN